MKNLKGQDYNTQTSLFDERRTQSGEKSQRKDKVRNRSFKYFQSKQAILRAGKFKTQSNI